MVFIESFGSIFSRTRDVMSRINRILENEKFRKRIFWTICRVKREDLLGQDVREKSSREPGEGKMWDRWPVGTKSLLRRP